MTAAAGPWSVKGIEPKAREVAKDLARRSGLTLGEWLNQMIIDGEPEAPPSSMSDYGDAAYRGIPARDYTPPGEPFRAPARETETQRITRALDQLSARIEAAENRSTLAISGVDQSVMGVLSRLEAVERDQGSVAARFDGALEDVRQSQAKSSDRVRRLVDEDAPRVEAMKALEGAIGKMAEKLYEDEGKTRTSLNALREDVSNMSRRVDRAEVKVETQPADNLVDAVVARIAARLEEAENKTAQAVRTLESSFAGLDARLQTSEARAAPEADAAERRFDRLTVELSNKVETARTELAERLKDVAGGTLDRVETSLRELAGHVEQGERHSALAIDRMGREVMRIAASLDHRVGKVEARSAEAVEQVGGEMARIADAMEQRMGRQDTVQAQALEKLGGEIARIAEKLSERIASAEHRSTQSIDDVGEQLGRVTERLNQRYDRAQSELSDRIQKSEERTVKLLEEAQGKIDARLTETQRRAALEAAADAARHAAQAQAKTAAHDHEDLLADLAVPFGVAAAAQTLTSDPFAGESSRYPAVDAPLIAPPSHSPPLSSGFGLMEEPFGGLAPAAAAFEPESQAPSSTRAMLDQARAAVRQAAEKPEPRGRQRDLGGVPAGSVETPPFEGEPNKPFSFGVSNKKKKDGVTLRTALVASGTAAALAVTGAGAVLLVNSEMSGAGSSSDRQVAHFGVAPTAVAENEGAPPALPPTLPSVDASGTAPTAIVPAQMAVALAPSASQIDALKAPVTRSTPAPEHAPERVKAAAPTVAATPKPAAATIYSAAVRKIESNDPSGVDDLKKAANLGHPAAQFYLAKLYETGGAGLKKDLNEARLWTERAAIGGDVAAMHNLGLYYYEGEAGTQDSAKAALWFRKAADQGVKDSQYNLALLYAKGYGVAQNPAEAYKWYLIAAANGDEGAKTAAQTIRAQLTPETQAAAERSAAAFHAQSNIRTASTAVSPQSP